MLSGFTRSSIRLALAVGILFAGCAGNQLAASSDGGGSGSDASAGVGLSASSGAPSVSGGQITVLPSVCAATTPDSCSNCLALPKACQLCPNGETVCAHYVLKNGICGIETCAGVGVCEQGASCFSGESCSTTVDAGSYQCFANCECTPAGSFACTQSCPTPAQFGPATEDGGVQVIACSTGNTCIPTSTCQAIVAGCDRSCSCGSNGEWECTQGCGNDP